MDVLSMASVKAIEPTAPTFQSGAAARVEAETMPHLHPGKMQKAVRGAEGASFFPAPPAREPQGERRTPRSENAVFRAPQRGSRDLGPLRRFFGYFLSLFERKYLAEGMTSLHLRREHRERQRGDDNPSVTTHAMPLFPGKRRGQAPALRTLSVEDRRGGALSPPGFEVCGRAIRESPLQSVYRQNPPPAAPCIPLPIFIFSIASRPPTVYNTPNNTF